MTTSLRPTCTAMCSGVQPAMSTASKSCEWSIISLTMDNVPLRQATWRQLVPFASQASQWAPAADENNEITRRTEPFGAFRSLSELETPKSIETARLVA